MEYWEAQEGEPFLLWARYRAEFELISELFKRNKVSFGVYNGGTKEEDRSRQVAAFNGGDLQVLCLSEAAGGTGLNLQLGGCSRAFYFSHTDNGVDRWQSEARIDRIGGSQLGGSVYTNLIAKGSFDRAIIRRNKVKKELGEQAVGQNWLVDYAKEEGDWDV